MARTYTTIFDLKVFAGDRDQALEKIVERTAEKNFFHISFISGLRLLRSCFSKKTREIYRHIDLLLPTGCSVSWAARRHHQPLAARFAAIDIMMDLIRAAIAGKRTVFFLGSSQDILNLAVEKLRQSFPELKIIGSHHGFFGPKRGKDIVEAIKKFSPDYLFAGLGHPYQDRWLRENHKHFSGTTCVSVGNAFDLCAGIKKRGSVWYRRHGLEGMYKAFQNPLRLWRLLPLPVFIIRILWDTLIRKKGRKQ